jgi:hypothetical protein
MIQTKSRQAFFAGAMRLARWPMKTLGVSPESSSLPPSELSN